MMYSACFRVCRQFFCKSVTEERKRGQNTARTTAPEAKHRAGDNNQQASRVQFTNPRFATTVPTVGHFETPVGLFRIAANTLSELEVVNEQRTNRAEEL